MKRLSTADLNLFRERLLAERATILGAASLTVGVLDPLDNLSAEDQAPLLHDQAVTIHCRSQESMKLKQIQAALQRLRSGDFGICQSCEEPIPRRRLLAIPWADRCVPCQERLHGGGWHGDRTGLAA